jgi:Na+/proline symporter
MTSIAPDLSVTIFVFALAATFLASYLGWRHSTHLKSDELSGQRLSKWLVGLSAGAAANSGFVVTGAVGLGYSFGPQWLLLPIAWLLGDIVFWAIFPERINRLGTAVKATTLTDIIVFGLPRVPRYLLKFLISTIVLTCLAGYVSAQWLAGQKFLQGAFGFTDFVSLFLFAALIVLYSAIGGFRGSVYADSLQAIIRILGTVVAVVAVLLAAHRDQKLFWKNLEAAGPDFFMLLPHNSLFAALAFTLGFAAAALGFGLGQPQIVTRYLAGASPTETRSAWWIYISFVQFTWIAMTAFGVLLRGVMPNISDPETGLSIFFRSTMGPILTGIIVADIFATIAATSNSLLVAMAQTAKFDLLNAQPSSKTNALPLWPLVAVLGILTMILSTALQSSVVSLALSSVSLMGAGLAPAMIIRLFGWRHSASSLTLSVIMGFSAATAWKMIGLGAFINEAAPGILAGLLFNALAVALARERGFVAHGG